MLSRRALVVGGLSSLAGCSRCQRAPVAEAVDPSATVLPPPPPVDDAGTGNRGEVFTETWSFGADGRAVTIVPAWRKPDEKLPMLVALHGRGEAMKGPERGVMGWPKDYELLRAIRRVCAPPLTTDDFEGFVDPERLALHNDALSKREFAGLVVLCAYAPDVDLRKPPAIEAYAKYLTETVLARARKDLPVVDGAVGIDGVSLGGALALRIGLGRPEQFAAVGTLQAAIGQDQIPELTELARSALTRNPRLKLRLLTSHDDYFRKAITSASAAWKTAGIAHELEDVPGPHDYPFNRGPGAIEMLLWHDRVLPRS